MGAAPSRETIEQGLPQPPFYGQRQQIVLIPLLKKFFPSADCPLFAQLYESRCDPAVRYYYYADDAVTHPSPDTPQSQPHPPTLEDAETTTDTSAAKGGATTTAAAAVAASGVRTTHIPTPALSREDIKQITRHLAKDIGPAPFFCPPVDIVQPVHFTRQAMYDAYVTNGGETMVYETDAEMLAAYRRDPDLVRPLPCAVAFLYHRSRAVTPPPSNMGAAGGLSPSRNGTMRAADGQISANNTAAAGGALAPLPHYPEDCSEVLGCYVKATGFVGDVQGLGGRHPRGACWTTDYELQMFLTKSAGDHNRTHVLLTAMYTYAEQWQRACLHCLPYDLIGRHGQPPRVPKEGSTDEASDADAANAAESPELAGVGDASFYYRPFTQTHELIMEASRRAAAVPQEAEGTSATIATAHTPAASTTPDRKDVLPVEARYWAPPPVSALIVRSRRANVPLLCFLREVRACVANMYIFHVRYYYQGLPGVPGSISPSAATQPSQTSINVNGEEDEGETAPTEAMVMAAAAGGTVDARLRNLTRHPHMLPPGSWHAWMQDVVNKPLPFTSKAVTEEEGKEEGLETESVLNVHATAAFVHSLLEYIVVCLLHSLNPLEAFRPQVGGRATATGAASEGEPTAAAEENGEGTTEGEEGQRSSIGATTSAALVPHSLSLFRLPDKNILVESWPPTLPTNAATEESSSTTNTTMTQQLQKCGLGTEPQKTPVSVLADWRAQHPTQFLLWVVGPDIDQRRSATAALHYWVDQEQAPVIWGYHLDEHDRELSSSSVSNSFNKEAQHLTSALYPHTRMSDYMNTVTMDEEKEGRMVSVDEVVLRDDTVLMLRAMEPGAEVTARVLRVCRLPLEELLLGELRNASKLAREAGPEDTHWVREVTHAMPDKRAARAQEAEEENGYQNCVLRAGEPAAGGDIIETINSNGVVELPTVPAAADGIVGDGTSCLWRVDLVDGRYRVIAVTPQFLKPMRKKHPKKKKLPAKVVAQQGTAARVFLGAASNITTNTPAVAAEMKKEGQRVTEMAKGTVTPAAAAADVTIPTTITLSKNQKKKAKRAAAAAAAVTACTNPTTEATVPAEMERRAQSSASSAATPTSGHLSPTKMRPRGHTTSTTTSSNSPLRSVTTPPRRTHVPSAVPPAMMATTGAPCKKTPLSARDLTHADPSGLNSPPEHQTPTTVTTAATTTSPSLTGTGQTTPHTRPIPQPPPALTPPRPLPTGEMDAQEMRAAVSAVAGLRASSGHRTTPLPASSVFAKPYPGVGGGSLPTPAASSAAHSVWAATAFQSGYGHGNSHAYPPTYAAYPRGRSGLPAYAADAPAMHGTSYSGYDQENDYGYVGGNAGGAGAGSSGANGAASLPSPPPPPPFGPYGGATSAGADGGYDQQYYYPHSYDHRNYPTQYTASKPPPPPPPPATTATGMNGFHQEVTQYTESAYACPMDGQHSHNNGDDEGYRSCHPSCIQAEEGVPMQDEATMMNDHAAAASAAVTHQEAYAGVPDEAPTSAERHVNFLRGATPEAELSAESHTTTATNTMSAAMPPPPQHYEEEPNANSLSVGAAHLQFQTEALVMMTSSIANASGTFPMAAIHPTHYAGSPYLQQLSNFEEVEAASGSNVGPAGGSVQVHVRVRHPHHSHNPSQQLNHSAHSRTTSLFSDSMADCRSLPSVSKGGQHSQLYRATSPSHLVSSPSTAAPPNAEAMMRTESSLSGFHYAHSFASAGSSSVIFHSMNASPTSVHGGSIRERGSGGAEPGSRASHSDPRQQVHSASNRLVEMQVSQQASSQQSPSRNNRHLAHVAGVASSTRSGETTSTARLLDKHSRTYRWDWRSAGLDMGEED